MSTLHTTLSEHEGRLLERAARWPGYASWDELRTEALRDLAAREGIELATAVLYDRIRASPQHGPAIERLDAPPTAEGRVDALVAVAPGAFYKEYPHTGADGRVVREEAGRFGCRSALIPAHSFGTLADNARLICRWLTERAEEPVVLVSLSKGSADVAAALALPEAERAFRRVAVWVNLSGIPRGTPLVGWLLARPLRTLLVRLLFWYRGYPFAALRELDRETGGLAGLEPRLPVHLGVLHVVGFPLARHLCSRQARRGYRRLTPLGPNDSGALLADVCALPGVIYPVWGADHYLRPGGGDLRGLFARVLRFLAQEHWLCLSPRVPKEAHEDPAPAARR